MFCGKCGSEIKEGEKFCAVCGTPVREEGVQTESGTPASNEVSGVNMETPVQPTFDNTQAVWNSTPANEPKKGKKAGVFVAIAVAAVLLVAVVACVVNAASINNFLHKTFSSPEEYFQYVMKKEVAENSKRAGGLYSDMISKFNFYDTGYNAELTIELGEEMKVLAKMADAYMDLESAGIDLSKLESFKVGTGISIKDSIVGYSLTTNINQSALLSLNGVMDLTQGNAYFQIPELSEVYLGLNVEDYDVDYYDVDSLTEAQDMNKAIVKALPKQADVEEMVQRYSNIIIKNIDDVTIGSKKQLKVKDISQKCTELKVTIDGKTMKNIMEAVIKEALKDKKIEKMITEIADAAGQDGADSYDEFVDSLESVKSMLSYLRQSDIELELRIYVDGKGNVIGSIVDFGEDRQSSFLSVTKGKNTAYEISLVEDGENIYSLIGKGKTSRGLLSGEFALEVEDKSIAKLKVSNLDSKKLKSGYFNGSVEIIPSSEMGDLLAEEFSVPIASLVEDCSILLDCKSSADEVEYKVTVSYDKEKLLGAVLAVKAGSGSKASIPDRKSVIMIEDEDDLMDYVGKIDWDKLVAALEKTGVFAKFAENLENAVTILDMLPNGALDMPGISGGFEDFSGASSGLDLFGQKNFDAAAYLQATLDNSYKNDASGLVKLKIGTAAEAAVIYEEGIDEEIDALLNGLSVSDALEEEFREVFKDMFSKVKYTVGKAEKQDDGLYVVTVTYEKMVVFAPMMEDFTTAIMNLHGNASFIALSESEQMEKLMEAMKDSTETALGAITYEEPAEMTVRVAEVNGVYTPNKNDLAKLEMALFDMESVQ